MLLALIAFFSACTSGNSPSVSFYYWKTEFQLDDKEKATLSENGVSKLYIRYFDVALKNGSAVPRSAITFKTPPGTKEIVPVIYIRNDVMLSRNFSASDLAKKVIDLINQINARYALTITEIQFDCDWTLKSKGNYFKFIEEAKKLTPMPLSATIRLHQVKHYKNTGVPPVKQGVLMYYNMGRIAADSLNSIYDRRIAKRYVNYLSDYPLPLTVALPIFSWGIHIRNNKVIGLLNKVDDGIFKNDPNFRENSNNFFDVTDNVIKLEHAFQKGDRVKIESVDREDLIEMADELTKHITTEEVIFYDLDSFNLKRYDGEQFYKKISSRF